ncbi:MAG: NAD+ synthase [Phycisphaerales bacterium]
MRVFLATFNPTVGDIWGNTGRMSPLLDSARRAGAELVLFPELSVSGYPPRDLLTHEGFVPACVAAAQALGERATAGLTCVFGCPLPVDRSDPRAGTTNSLLVYRDNAFVASYDKRLLPTYDVFDEDRYFEPGSRAVVIDVPTSHGVVRAGLTICEDLWKGKDAGFSSRYRGAPDPVCELIAAGAQCVLSASASPFVVGKGERHVDILAAHARAHGVPVCSVNQLGGNDDLVFDGHRYVLGPGGEMMASGGLFEDGALLVELAPSVSGGLGVVPQQVAQRAEDAGQLFHALRLGVQDYLRKTGFRSALLGLSGGIDSALTAVIGVAAVGREQVLGVSMPGPYSSDHSVGDARELASALGMRCIDAPIAAAMEGFRGAVGPVFRGMAVPALGERLPDVTEENLQSRIRGTLLMTISNRTGAIVLTTGNKSESAVGYATLYGDMNGGLAVLSDVNKQWIYALSRFINAHYRSLPGLGHCTRPPIPERSITKPPSAELRPNQTDQDSLPPYDVLDSIIDLYVEHKHGVGHIAEETGFDRDLVAKIARMIDLAEYKRQQAAVGLKVTSVAFGAGRRYPVAQGWRSV